MLKASTILIVDDNQADSNYIITLLNNIAPGQFVTMVAEDISKALNLLDHNQIDIITLDLFLPDSAGLNTLLSIRSRSPDVPIVVVSGISDQKVAKEALYYGAHSFLVKGEYDGEQLLDAMVRAITKQSQITLMAAIKRMQKDLDDSMNSRKIKKQEEA